ncbi:MAG TPA: hypothetical protein VE959_19810 [Bryobacteraceae bacterium]|nr:hypothetical protein [Bryobacteraceae bacterium]
MRQIVLSAALAALSLPLWADDNKDTINAQETIQKFAAKEGEFQQARNNYTYRQSVKLQELDAGGNPTGGQWELVEDVIFTPEGKRMEKVVYAPVQTLRNILLTPEDEQDLRNVQPFVLTTAEIPEYDINFLGREKVDEIGCYVFSVKPKKLVQGKRYFEGQIWVDDRDLQIVKTYGKGVGVIKKSSDNQFPKFETYREQIDGKYWFPTYTHADDTLHFKNGPQRIRMTVKYQDYKRYEGKSTIKYGEVVDDKAAPPTPAKKK